MFEVTSARWLTLNLKHYFGIEQAGHVGAGGIQSKTLTESDDLIQLFIEQTGSLYHDHSFHYR